MVRLRLPPIAVRRYRGTCAPTCPASELGSRSSGRPCPSKLPFDAGTWSRGAMTASGEDRSGLLRALPQGVELKTDYAKREQILDGSPEIEARRRYIGSRTVSADAARRLRPSAMVARAIPAVPAVAQAPRTSILMRHWLWCRGLPWPDRPLPSTMRCSGGPANARSTRVRPWVQYSGTTSMRMPAIVLGASPCSDSSRMRRAVRLAVSGLGHAISCTTASSLLDSPDVICPFA